MRKPGTDLNICPTGNNHFISRCLVFIQLVTYLNSGADGLVSLDDEITLKLVFVIEYPAQVSDVLIPRIRRVLKPCLNMRKSGNSLHWLIHYLSHNLFFTEFLGWDFRGLFLQSSNHKNGFGWFQKIIPRIFPDPNPNRFEVIINPINRNGFGGWGIRDFKKNNVPSDAIACRDSITSRRVTVGTWVKSFYYFMKRKNLSPPWAKTHG